MLELKDVDTAYGAVPMLRGVTISVIPGELVCLLGPNGAGKTTLFNALAGLVALTRGDIVFDGESIVGLRSFQRAERGIARTFQNLQIFRELSLLENVMIGRHPRTRAGFFASLAGLPSVRREETDIEARAYDKLALLGLADRADSSAAGLSFGEAKLLEIARALVAEPRLLLLDEPAAGVPHGEQAALSAIIRRVNDSGVTVLLVEHNMRMVMNLCHEVLVLNYGRHLAEGPPAEVSRNRDVIVAYLGEEAVHA